ncbi:MAG: LemA family protein [Bacteroidales bacterium]|nr:LemA family protein [Bacteroidales bacterium]
MKKGISILIVVLAILAIFAGWYIGIRNKLVKYDEEVAAQWSQVESNYQRRNDLIGNLVKTVQGAADFERSTYREITEARANANSIKLDASDLTEENIQAYQAAQDRLGQALNRTIAVTVENYPQLTATQNFRDLQVQLEGTENRINVARENFNGSVRRYNTAIRQFPSNIVAAMANFEKRGYFKSVAGAETAPDVQFDFN